MKYLSHIFPFSDFIYILQQEEYSSMRYVHWLPRFFFRRQIQVRQHLVWTARVKMLFATSTLVYLVVLSVGIIHSPLYILPLIVILTIICIPLDVLVANLLTSPIFALMKNRQLYLASAKVKSMTGLRVIAVAGSYGKTTIKQCIYEMIRYTKRSQMIEGNINTPLGIANWVSAKLQQNTEVLLVEMDTYRQGEIAESCWVTPPDIAILANIGDQHLERFAGPTDHAKALSEIFTFAKPSAILVADAETLQTLRKQTGFVPSRNMRIEEVTPKGTTARNINTTFALKAAEILAVPIRFKEDTLIHFEEPERRKRKTKMYGYDAIDDSYNISFTTVSASLAEAREYANTQGKKLLVVTAGIPELPKDRADNLRKFGLMLSSAADHTYVLGSMFQDEICWGIGDDTKYTRARDLSKFVSNATRKYSTHEYVLLVLPELTDLYY